MDTLSPLGSEVALGHRLAGGPLDDVDVRAGGGEGVVDLAQLGRCGRTAGFTPAEQRSPQPAGLGVGVQPVDADEDAERAAEARDVLDDPLQPGAGAGGDEEDAGGDAACLAAA